MTQLVVHAYDETAGRLRPAYAVCRTGPGLIFTEAFNSRWQETASRIEVALNAESAGRLGPGAAGEAECAKPGHDDTLY